MADEHGKYDPYRTTPRLPGEPMANYELRAALSTVHKRVDSIFDKLSKADKAREELLTIATNVSSDMKHFVNKVEDHEARIRKVEDGDAKKTGIAIALGAAAGYLSSFFHK